MDLLEQINEMGTTVIMVTHDPEPAHRAHRTSTSSMARSRTSSHTSRATSAGDGREAGRGPMSPA